MNDFLLHPALVADLLADVSDPRAGALIEAVEKRGAGIWLPVAGIEAMLDGIGNAISGSAVEARSEARDRLKRFAASCTWLGSPASDADALRYENILDWQLQAGLKRLGAGARLVVNSAKGDHEVAVNELLEVDEPARAIAFIDLPRQQRRIRGVIEDGLLGVLAHGRYIAGPEIDELERRLAEYVGVRHALAVSNGTDALLIALMAVGVGAGDEVITSPFTFAATGEMIHLLGARPVYVDIDPVTYNMDPSKIEAAVTSRTRAILPVSIFGQCADMDAINTIAARHGLPVIEDGAQSFGATYKGNRSCGLSLIGCTSFFPSKPLGGYGDSGACFSDDDDAADAMRQIRDHGQTGRYRHTRLGINGRMSSFQASVLLAKLDLFEEEVALRADAGARYDALFAERMSEITSGEVVLPSIGQDNTSVYAQYSLLVARRDHVQDRLAGKEIPTAVHYPVPLNRQPAMRDDDCRVPVAEDVSARVLSIPFHPYICASQQTRVVEALVEAARAI